MAQKEQSIKLLVSDPVHNEGERSAVSHDRYRKIVEQVARPGTTVEYTSLRKGYFRVRGTPYADTVNAAGMAEKAYEAEKQGYDAFIIGCVWDPGLKEARCLAKIPVVAPTESAILLALTLGRKFSAIADSPQAALKYADLIRSYGLGKRLASVRCPPGFVPGTDFGLIFGGEKTEKEFAERVTAEMRLAVKEDSAEVLWYACTLGTALLNLRGIHKVDGAVVIDPFVAALKMAEILVDLQRACGTSVCRASIYEPPPAGWEKEQPVKPD